MKWLVFAAAVACSGCGAKVVLEDDGGGGSAGDGGGGSTATSGSSCDALYAAFQESITDAIACDPSLNSVQCTGEIILLDTCGCPTIVANERTPELAEQVKAAYTAWTDASCGPIPCSECVPVDGGACEPTNGPGTVGQCIGITLF